MLIKCEKNHISSFCPQGHVRKAQALVSLGRTEEALREYLMCLSIEPDCRLAKTEINKVNPTLELQSSPCESSCGSLFERNHDT